MRGDFEGMVNAYMALLSTKPNYLRTVQNSLNRNLRLTTIEDNRRTRTRGLAQGGSNLS